MDPNDPNLYGAFAGFGVIAVLVYLLFTAGVIALSLWLTYTIIWRAVRRGLKEFHYPRQR